MPTRIDRRIILGSGAAFGVLTAAELSAQTTSVVVADVKVTVTLSGATYTYPDGPKIPSYYVSFREDGRIVFHLGALGDLAKKQLIPAYHLGPHHVKIEKGATVLLDIDVPSHWWNAEWTYRPAQILPTKTPAEIVAANRMFKYGNTGARLPAVPNYVYKGPMDSAGITIYMPTTGERADIGLITDVSARYMLGDGPGPMLSWAQAAGSCPMHFRDEATEKPVDLIRYPSANSYGPNSKGPYMVAGPPNPDAPVYAKFGGGWTPQQAHYCEMSYVAYCATLDMGFLEDLQFSANFTVLCNVWISQQRNIATIYGEYRGVAWAFRNLFMAHVATKDAESRGPLPKYLHPSSYWKQILDNQLSLYGKSITDPDKQYFRLIGPYPGPIKKFGPWQVDYMLMALAFGVLTGHSDWSSLYLWALKNAIDRTSGKSGYPVGYGGAYYMDASNGDWYNAFLKAAPPEASPPTQAQIDALKIDPFNGGKAMTGFSSLVTTRAVLVAARYLHNKGLIDVLSAYPDLDACIANVDRMVRANGSMNPRVSVIM